MRKHSNVNITKIFKCEIKLCNFKIHMKMHFYEIKCLSNFLKITDYLQISQNYLFSLEVDISMKYTFKNQGNGLKIHSFS